MKIIITNSKKKYVSLILSLLLLLTPINFAFAFAYIFAGEGNGVGVITHPIGYTGFNNTFTITVGIDPSTDNANEMVIPVQNVINIYNNLQSSITNLVNNEIPGNAVGFESVLLHEMGHSLGLAHCNLASESGLEGEERDYTKSTNGSNNIYEVTRGADQVIGSDDDVRGDDVNLNYFKLTDNNPFTLPASNIIDETTYSRNGPLPNGGVFSANGSRDVADLLGVPNTETVMQQGTSFGEAQRTLSADDVAGLRYAMAGLDEIQGTADDYVFTLEYVGFSSNADIIIDFDNSETGFAVSQNSGNILSFNHIAIASSRIFFNGNFNWFFNNVLNTEDVSNPLSIRLFPNPSEDFITLKNSTLITLESVTIYDSKGRLIKTITNGFTNAAEGMPIDISGYDAGVYFFDIKTKQGTIVKRVVKK